MTAKELIEKLEHVNPDAEIWFAETTNFPVKAGYIMYAEETGKDEDDTEAHLAFHDGNYGMSDQLAILICEEE
jgi:hypothetical protein